MVLVTLSMWKEPLFNIPQNMEIKMTAMGLFLAMDAIMTPSQPRLVANAGLNLPKEPVISVPPQTPAMNPLSRKIRMNVLL